MIYLLLLHSPFKSTCIQITKHGFTIFYLYFLLVMLSLILNSVSNQITGSTAKPEDFYRIIEHFSLGRRRIELFGEDHNIRSGWLTVGKGLSSSDFNAEVKVPSLLSEARGAVFGKGNYNLTWK